MLRMRFYLTRPRLSSGVSWPTHHSCSKTLALTVIRSTFFLAAVCCYLIALRTWHRAIGTGNLSEYGRGHPISLFFLGPSASERYFTEDGWRLFVRSRRWALAGFSAAVVAILTW